MNAPAPGPVPAVDSADLIRESKFLAYVLRHKPSALGLSLDPAGWVDVDTLLTALAGHGHRISRECLDDLVRGIDKQRFQIERGRIRAVQGHSVDVDLELPLVPPPDILFHGTVERFLSRIEREGLRPMQRRHVHLSATMQAARVVGARRGVAVVLRIDAAAAQAAGHPFRRALNGIWLTDHVPPALLSRPETLELPR
jgi:putative RNA 2'-phosphotransferase